MPFKAEDTVIVVSGGIAKGELNGIAGQDQIAKRRIEDALRETGEAEAIGSDDTPGSRTASADPSLVSSG